MKISSTTADFAPITITISLESVEEVQSLHAFFGNTGRLEFHEQMKSSRHYKAGGDVIMSNFGQKIYDHTRQGSIE